MRKTLQQKTSRALAATVKFAILAIFLQGCSGEYKFVTSQEVKDAQAAVKVAQAAEKVAQQTFVKAKEDQDSAKKDGTDPIAIAKAADKVAKAEAALEVAKATLKVAEARERQATANLVRDPKARAKAADEVAAAEAALRFQKTLQNVPQAQLSELIPVLERDPLGPAIVFIRYGFLVSGLRKFKADSLNAFVVDEVEQKEVALLKIILGDENITAGNIESKIRSEFSLIITYLNNFLEEKRTVEEEKAILDLADSYLLLNFTVPKDTISAFSVWRITQASYNRSKLLFAKATDIQTALNVAETARSGGDASSDLETARIDLRNKGLDYSIYSRWRFLFSKSAEPLGSNSIIHASHDQENAGDDAGVVITDLRPSSNSLTITFQPANLTTKIVWEKNNDEVTETVDRKAKVIVEGNGDVLEGTGVVFSREFSRGDNTDVTDYIAGGVWFAAPSDLNYNVFDPKIHLGSFVYGDNLFPKKDIGRDATAGKATYTGEAVGYYMDYGDEVKDLTRDSLIKSFTADATFSVMFISGRDRATPVVKLIVDGFMGAGEDVGFKKLEVFGHVFNFSGYGFGSSVFAGQIGDTAFDGTFYGPALDENNRPKLAAGTFGHYATGAEDDKYSYGGVYWAEHN